MKQLSGRIFVKSEEFEKNSLTPSVSEFMWRYYPEVRDFRIEGVNDQGVWVVWDEGSYWGAS